MSSQLLTSYSCSPPANEAETAPSKDQRSQIDRAVGVSAIPVKDSAVQTDLAAADRRFITPSLLNLPAVQTAQPRQPPVQHMPVQTTRSFQRSETESPEFEQELDVISLLSASSYNNFNCSANKRRYSLSPSVCAQQQQPFKPTTGSCLDPPVYLFDSDTSMSHSLTDLLLMDNFRAFDSRVLPAGDFGGHKHASVRGKHVNNCLKSAQNPSKDVLWRSGSPNGNGSNIQVITGSALPRCEDEDMDLLISNLNAQ